MRTLDLNDLASEAERLNKATDELLGQDTEDFTPRERTLFAAALMNLYDQSVLSLLTEADRLNADVSDEGSLAFVRESALVHLRIAEVQAAL